MKSTFSLLFWHKILIPNLKCYCHEGLCMSQHTGSHKNSINLLGEKYLNGSHWPMRQIRLLECNSACWGILHNRYCLHLSFFSNITSLSYFLDRQNPDFFPFSNSQFLRTGTRRTYVHPFDLDYWAKTRYQPIFRHCLGAVLPYLVIFYENLH